jgi:hypothetical protein
VDQKLYFRDCKSLSVFERKIPLTFFSEYRFHQFLFGIFQITDFSQDYSWAGGKMYPKKY